jgi:signal transduction histidine kinase
MSDRAVSERIGPRPISLLNNLFGRMGALFIAIVLIVGLATFFTAQRRINEIYDGQLIIGANVLRALMSDELQETPNKLDSHDSELEIDDSPLLSAEDRRAFNSYAEWRMFRVWRGPRLVLQSDTGPKETAPPAREGFSTRHAHHKRWRVYTLKVPNSDVSVEVGERTDIRLVLVRGIAVGLALPLLLLIPTAGLLIWLALNGGLRALRLLFDEIGRRSMRDLSLLPLSPWPRDLHPLVRSINRLFERIDRSLQQERRFLDDAAHQLRTPLAAVKLQAQMIARETDPAERQALIAQLSASVDRASALTDSLLTLARLEARMGAGAGDGGDLKHETVAAMADLAPLAARRGVELSFEGAGDMPSGDPVLLRLIAANLLENAINHAPPQTEVQVRLWSDHGRHHLLVTDAGSGIPITERERVLQRFHRGRDAAPNGSGLGLSIVVEALRLLDGQLVLLDRDDGVRGLQARAELLDRGGEKA